jgi:hypothetical protein
MADTQVAWPGYFSSAYAEMALTANVRWKQSHGMIGLDLHNSGHHADIHHDPTKGDPDPVLVKVHRQTVREQTSCHAANGNPNSVESVFGPPVCAMVVVDPLVEEEPKDPA